MYEVKKVLFFFSHTYTHTHTYTPFLKKKYQILFNFCSNHILCPLHTGKIVIWRGKKCPLCTVPLCRRPLYRGYFIRF